MDTELLQLAYIKVAQTAQLLQKAGEARLAEEAEALAEKVNRAEAAARIRPLDLNKPTRRTQQSVANSHIRLTQNKGPLAMGPLAEIVRGLDDNTVIRYAELATGDRLNGGEVVTGAMLFNVPLRRT